MTLTFEQKSAINARFQEHYDALKAAGKHGFYETCFEAMHLAYASLALPQQDEWRDRRFRIEHDGFVGTVIGTYTRLDGKRGVVMQQDGTNVVHVYGEKWLTDNTPEGLAPAPSPPGEER